EQGGHWAIWRGEAHGHISERFGGFSIPGEPPANMVWIHGGSFLMGSNDFYPEERPVRRVAVEGFWMDAHPVTNAQFREFVDATGYVTVAERTPDPRNYPGIDPEQLVPGALVVRRPSGPVDVRGFCAWWVVLPGAS